MKKLTIPESPVHILSAFVTVVLDWLWFMPEVPATVTGIGLLVASLMLCSLCLLAVCMVQRFVAGDEWGAAIAKGLVMGIAAGVPYPVVGTVVGVPLLVWSGIHYFIRQPSSALISQSDDK